MNVASAPLVLAMRHPCCLTCLLSNAGVLNHLRAPRTSAEMRSYNGGRNLRSENSPCEKIRATQLSQYLDEK